MSPSFEHVVDEKVRRVIEAGHAQGIEVEPVTFPDGTRTAADAARAVGCDVSQIVKSLVFDGGSSPVLLLVSGANRVDVDVAAVAAGVERLERADAELARAATGYSIGATPPVGLARDLPVLMDEDLLAHDVVWAAAGRPDSVFAVEPHALARASGAKVCRLTS
jgi:prolyl-tRNA editing enzyme YbaK/EbsC (Cys-tRNA(Pro) deacylase)